MSELHYIIQENASTAAVPAFASPQLPTVGTIYARSWNVRDRASLSSSCMRVVLATLASVAAIVVLVFLCSSGYRRRTVQGIRSRRLASLGDSDAQADACGSSGNNEEKEQREKPHPPSLSGVEGEKLPIKKRLLARVAETGSAGEGRNPQQQEQQDQQQQDQQQKDQQQQHREQPETSSDVYPAHTASPPEQGGVLSLSPSNTLPTTPVRTPTQLDNQTRQHAAGPSAPDAKQTTPPQVSQLEGQQWRLQQNLLSEEWHYDPLQIHPRQDDQDEPYLPHQQQHNLHLQNLIWWQQQTQQMLQQQQEQYLSWYLHAHQQPLQQQQQQQQALQQQGQQQLLHPGGQQYEVQQPEYQHAMQQVTQQPMLQDEHGREHEKKKRKRKHQEGLEPEGEQGQPPLQPGKAHQGYLPEDWIHPDSPRSEMAQPSTSQQALPSFTGAGAAGPSTSFDYTVQASPSFPLLPLTRWQAPAVEALRDEDALAAAKDAAEADAVARAATAGRGVEHYWPYAGPPTAASSALNEYMSWGGEGFSSVLTDVSFEGGGPAAAAAAAAMPAYAPPPAFTGQPLMPPPAFTEQPFMWGFVPDRIREHPFVRLPRRIVERTPDSILIDMRSAVSRWPGRRDAVPLLQEARELLSRRILYFPGMRDLAHVSKYLIEHAVNHEHHDLSVFQASRAVERLGIRFLLLDVVVSTFIVLGQTPDSDSWKVFTDAISHAAPPLVARRSNGGQRVFYSCLSQELSRAIQILKTGRRPLAEDLLRIKRMLFCLACSPTRFQRRAFDRWREDDFNSHGEK
ncbi:hypothetical protein EPH_0004960 [Eimeria praecox]|uniref:Uncharacterized protein n=1 Tax=Eimeria praecox TaxID=51316 RepID=U6G7K7_9EIME|nr:hypothetical protein EPH_0004960 [Eimeria praecox]